MQEQDTINILISQLLSKDDELLRFRKDNELIGKNNECLLAEQREGNRQILEKLDKALDELQSMRIDNKHLANQLFKALEDKAQAEKQSELLSSALEELNLGFWGRNAIIVLVTNNLLIESFWLVDHFLFDNYILHQGLFGSFLFFLLLIPIAWYIVLFMEKKVGFLFGK